MWSFLSALILSRRLDGDMDQEWQFHLDARVDSLMAGGLCRAEAEQKARVEFGDPLRWKEQGREAYGVRWAQDLGADVRYALRQMRRAPVFTGVVVTTVALGIGFNTAIFSIVNGVILRPLGYPQPEQLMYITTRYPALGVARNPLSPPEYMEFRRLNQSFAVVGGYATGEVNIAGIDRPRSVRSAYVDDGLLRALSVQPEAGRLFLAGETEVTGPPPAVGEPARSAPAVAILSHGLWQSAFGRQPILGTAVEVNGRRREIIGILPPGVDVPGVDLMDNRTEIWLPLGLNATNPGDRLSHFLGVIGRLNRGVTLEAARSELETLVENWSERAGAKDHVFMPMRADASAKAPRFEPGHVPQIEPLQQLIIGGARRPILLLQVAVAFVLLIVCANLASLLLARAETRRREFAVRTALGAGRGRLLRQLMTEGILMSAAGGALGVWIGHGAVATLLRTYPTSLPRSSDVTVDIRVMLLSLAVATAAGLLFGLAPAVHARVKPLGLMLKECGDRAGSGAGRHYVRRGLVIMEVAMAVMLVLGAGLLLRTVHNLTRVNAGFDRSRLVTFSVTLPQANYPQPATRAHTYERLLQRVRAVPGIQAATAMSGLPPNRPPLKNNSRIANSTAPAVGPYEIIDYYQYVMADYFETLGIPMVQGRGFQRTDTGSSGNVAVVNETLVNTFWNGQDPIGQRVKPCCNDQPPWFTVVGVAKDVKQGGLDRPAGTEFYFSVEQIATLPPPMATVPYTMNVVMRTTLPLATLSSTLDRVVRNVDSTVPVVRLRDMEDVFAETIQRPRLLAHLLSALGTLALVLAAVGTYGVLSYLVTERRREIGIRMALGADRSRILTDLMKHGIVLTGIGVLGGLAGAFTLNRLIASLLFGVRPMDTTTLGVVIATMILVAAIACWMPAWRASQLDPNVTLRED
jgi:predicted permease